MAVRGKRNGELRPPSKKGKNGDAAEAERQMDAGEVPAERESNVVKLSEDQIFSLLASQYRPMFETSLEAKRNADKAAKSAASAHKTACKKIIVEMGDDAVDKIRDMIKLDEDGGEEKMRAVIARQIWVARYMAAPLGTQFSLLGEDRTPAVDTAANIGRAEGLGGKRFDPSRWGQGTEQLASYEKTFYVGQEEMMRAKLLPLEPPPPIGDTEPPQQEAVEPLPPSEAFTAGEQPNP